MTSWRETSRDGPAREDGQGDSRASDGRPLARIRVVADDRERGAGTIASLRALDGVDVEIRRLTLGDYAVDERLLVERKTLADLAESIKSGRLFRQVGRLAAGPHTGALIIEGGSRDLEAVRMRREAIQGALVSVTLIYGLPVLRSLEPEETARLMVYAAGQMRSAAAGALPRKRRRPRGKRKAQLRLLQGLPGIGPGRAAGLLDAFGSVQGVVNASHEALRGVDGIGAATAKAIRWVLDGEENRA